MSDRVSSPVDVAIRVLGFHGVAIACSTVLDEGVPTSARVLATVVAIGPWLAWCFGPTRIRRLEWLSYGVVPASIVVGAAIAESQLPGGHRTFGAIRIAVGVAAQLVATGLLDRPSERDVTVEVRDHGSASAVAPTARARRRSVFVGVVATGLAMSVLAGPFLRRSATATERSFAAVAGAVFAATVCLTILPSAMRRERGVTVSTRDRVARVALLASIVVLALVLEWWSRPR